MPPAVETQSLNYCTTREVSKWDFYSSKPWSIIRLYSTNTARIWSHKEQSKWLAFLRMSSVSLYRYLSRLYDVSGAVQSNWNIPHLKESHTFTLLGISQINQMKLRLRKVTQLALGHTTTNWERESSINSHMWSPPEGIRNDNGYPVELCTQWEI